MAQKAQPTSVGSYHFSANKSVYEIQRGNNFEFVIDAKLNNLVAYGMESKTFPNAQEYIRLSVASSSVPHYEQSVIEVRRGNTAIKYAGPMSWGSGSLVCYDFIGAETKDILMAWQAKSGNPLYQTVAQQSEYKMNATLIEYTPDYSEKVRVWKLDGCWISGINEEDFSQDANGARRITCTIQYDRAYVDYSA